MVLHQLFISQRWLRLFAALFALIFVSLTLPVLILDADVDDVGRTLRAAKEGTSFVAVRPPAVTEITPVVATPIVKLGGRRQLSLGTNEHEFDIMGVEDDPDLLPPVPPLPGERGAESPPSEPLPPYDLPAVLAMMNHFHNTFGVLVYDPESDKFILHYNHNMRWTSSCHKLVTSYKMLANSLRTMFPERFNPEAPEFAIAMSSADYPALVWNVCLREGRSDCLDPGDSAPVLHFGSVFRDPIIPSFVAMPMPQKNHLGCYHFWMLHQQVCEYYLPRGPGNPKGLVFQENIGLRWENLIPQVVWRGTDFSYLRKMNPTLRSPNFDTDVASQIDLTARVDKRTAATQAIRAVYDELIPRWKGVVWTAEAEREADAVNERMLDRKRKKRQRMLKRVNWGGWESMLKNTKRARQPLENAHEHREMTRQQMFRDLPVAPWSNIKFASRMHMGQKTLTSEIEYYQQFEEYGIPAIGEGMSLETLGQFKYHIDLGGGGGTTWSGTLEKLGLPGLLFHHLTPTKDYLHDKLVPLVHYVPIKADLSDLREKFEWAESHPEMAKQISDNATLLARRLGTPEGMEGMFHQFYEWKLRQVVEAYRPLDVGVNWRYVVRQIAGESLRPILECSGYYHHVCLELVDDYSFERVHDRDPSASA